jgi:uncharacterized repeat protein (TIGR01451 family)
VAGVLGVVLGGGPAAIPAQAASGPDPSITVALDRNTYRLGDLITGTFTITNRGNAPAAGVVVHVFTDFIHIDRIDFGEFRQTNVYDAVLDRELAAGETVHLTIHASATGFLLAPLTPSLTGRVDYTADVDRTNNWNQVLANYDTSGSIAVVHGTVFVDANRDAVRQEGEVGGFLAEPSLWWAPDQGQGVGITAAGEYSFTGIIGQQYELHFDLVDPSKYVGTSARVYVFTLDAGGRTIDFGVVDPSEPTPTSPPPTPTTTAPTAAVPGAPNPGSPGGGLRMVNGVDTGAESSTVGPTQSAPPSTTTDSAAAAPQPDPTRTVAGVPSGAGESASWWPWLVVSVVGLVGLAGTGWLVLRRRRIGELS